MTARCHVIRTFLSRNTTPAVYFCKEWCGVWDKRVSKWIYLCVRLLLLCKIPSAEHNSTVQRGFFHDEINGFMPANHLDRLVISHSWSDICVRVCVNVCAHARRCVSRRRLFSEAVWKLPLGLGSQLLRGTEHGSGSLEREREGERDEMFSLRCKAWWLRWWREGALAVTGPCACVCTEWIRLLTHPALMSSHFRASAKQPNVTKSCVSSEQRYNIPLFWVQCAVCKHTQAHNQWDDVHHEICQRVQILCYCLHKGVYPLTGSGCIAPLWAVLQNNTQGHI